MQISRFDFTSQYRIEKSLNYLTGTNLSIAEIAILTKILLLSTVCLIVCFYIPYPIYNYEIQTSSSF